MSYRDDVRQLVITTINRNPGRTMSDEAGQNLIAKLGASLATLDPTADLAGIDVTQMWREVQAQCAIWVDDGRAHLRTWHRDWLSGRLGSTDWYFWKSYRAFLDSESQLPPRGITNMDELTNEVLKELGDPQEKGDWDRRGMVVGQVQAGKTANYTALINKALDTGYKIVIVLAGTQDDLRSQTQKRLDRGVIGGDTRLPPDGAVGWAKIGVGLYRTGSTRRSVIPITDATLEGDFSKTKYTGIEIGGESALLLVVKKNSRILRRIHKWAQAYAQERAGGQPGVLPDVPLLMIDDEADSAGINLAPNDEDGPSAINRRIREILNDFGQKSYVGYTATPFANIFIHPDDDDQEPGQYGPDLFPKDFIFNLPTPSNYVGPGELFGLSDPLRQDRANPGLPLIRNIEDYRDCFPDRHKKDLRVSSLPESLKQAVKVFVLVGAVRRARGQSCRHNSMLVHVTRYVNVQSQVAQLVQDEVTGIQRTLEFATGEPYVKLMTDLHMFWEQDLSANRDAVFEVTQDPMLIPVTWKAVSRELYPAASKIQIRTVNGMARDALDYDDYRDVGLSVIAVGGDKLSRGLTLEDISVSYYLRASTMYDTLLQMGRWFGYKDGFLDLCRLYTTRDIASYYQWIALASLELREEFDLMVQSQRTPADYGLRVRQHPTVLQVTSAGKMRWTRKMFVTYSGVLLETFCFLKNTKVQEHNFDLVKSWVGRLPAGGVTDRTGSITWKTVSGELVVELLRGFLVHPRCYKMDPRFVSEYIVKQMELSELKCWTVCIVSTKKTGRSVPFSLDSQYPDGWTPTRTDIGTRDSHEYLLSKQHMISPPDEYRDLTPEEWKSALNDTIQAWENAGRHGTQPIEPIGRFVRAHRDRNRGLLLIYPLQPDGDTWKDGWENEALPVTPVVGLAISLPQTASAVAVQYVGNQNWWKQRFNEEEDWTGD